MGKLSIIEMGEQVEVELVRYYNKNNTNYLMYTKDEVDEQGYVKVYASKITEEGGSYKTSDITNPTEWNSVKDTMKQIVRDNRELSPVSVEDFNPKVLNGLNVTEHHVFKLDVNIKDYLSSNQKKFEEEEEDDGVFTLENLMFQQPMVDPMFQSEVSIPSSTEAVPAMPTFEMPQIETPLGSNFASNAYPVMSGKVEDNIEELDLTGIHFEDSKEKENTIVSTEPEVAPFSFDTDVTPIVVPQEEATPIAIPEVDLTDITLMNLDQPSEEKETVSTPEVPVSWEQFEMPVTPMEEVPVTIPEVKEEQSVIEDIPSIPEPIMDLPPFVPEEPVPMVEPTLESVTEPEIAPNNLNLAEEPKEEKHKKPEKHKGFFSSLFGWGNKNEEEEPTTTEEVVPTVPVGPQSVEKATDSMKEAHALYAKLERSDLKLKEEKSEIPTMVEPYPFEPVAVEPISFPSEVEEIPVQVSESTPEVSESNFNFQSFDPLSETPDYNIPSFESLGLDGVVEPVATEEPTLMAPISSPSMEDENYQTLYFEEKRKAEDLEEKMHLLELQLDQQKKKLEEVKNIII